MEVPTSMKAIKTDGQGKLSLVADAPVPTVPEGYALVKVSHIALNPTDWKHLDYPTTGLTVGCDFSGTVVKVSPSASKTLATGDLVAGYAHGQKPDHPEQGCFAEYTIVKAGMSFKLPPSANMADACTLSLGAATVGQALYQRLNLPWPDQVGVTPSRPILIYGGSTVTGLLAIQMAKLSGWRVLATCSPHSFDKVRGVGADEVFDYRDATACVAAIRASTDGDLLYAFDCVGSVGAAQLCADALSQEKGRACFATISPFHKPIRAEDDLWQKSVFAYTAEGEAFNDYGIQWEARPQDYAHVTRFFRLIQELVGEGKIKSFPILREGGLSAESVAKGLDDLKNGRISGGKLVFQVA